MDTLKNNSLNQRGKSLKYYPKEVAGRGTAETRRVGC